MTLDELLAGAPAWNEHLVRAAAQDAKHRSIRADGEDVARRTAEVQVEWDLAMRAALDAGQMPPPRPPLLDPQAGMEAQAYMAGEAMQMAEERQRTIAALAEHAQALLRERETKRRTALQPVVAKLEAARVEAQADVGALAQVLTAVQRGATEVERPSPAERLRMTVTLDTLVAAVVVGSSLLDPAPRQQGPTSPFDGEIDRVPWTQEADGGVRLGLSNGPTTSYGTPHLPAGVARNSSRGVEI